MCIKTNFALHLFFDRSNHILTIESPPAIQNEICISSSGYHPPDLCHFQVSSMLKVLCGQDPTSDKMVAQKMCHDDHRDF